MGRGREWTSKEIATLMTLDEYKCSMQEIADKLGRTVQGVKTKLKYIRREKMDKKEIREVRFTKDFAGLVSSTNENLHIMVDPYGEDAGKALLCVKVDCFKSTVLSKFSVIDIDMVNTLRGLGFEFHVNSWESLADLYQHVLESGYTSSKEDHNTKIMMPNEEYATFVPNHSDTRFLGVPYYTESDAFCFCQELNKLKGYTTNPEQGGN